MYYLVWQRLSTVHGMYFQCSQYHLKLEYFPVQSSLSKLTRHRAADVFSHPQDNRWRRQGSNCPDTTGWSRENLYDKYFRPKHQPEGDPERHQGKALRSSWRSGKVERKTRMRVKIEKVWLNSHSLPNSLSFSLFLKNVQEMLPGCTGASLERWTHLLQENLLWGKGQAQECTGVFSEICLTDGESLVGGGLPCCRGRGECF